MRRLPHLLFSATVIGCGPAVATDDETSGSPSSGDTTAAVSEPETPPSPSEPATSAVSTDATTEATRGESSDEGSTTGGIDPTFPETTGSVECPGQPRAGAALGTPCAANDECASGLCPLYTDAPPSADATCAAPPGDCSTRFTGTVRDIVTGSPESVAVDVIAVLDALTNPAGATPDVSAPSDADGRYDFESAGPLFAAIAVVGRVGGSGPYALSAGVLSTSGSDGYPPGPDVHELWLVADEALQGWSAAIDDVPPKLLPLGGAGGIVGIVRDADGERVAGATVEPAQPGSTALIRYPRADGSVGVDQTDASGLFLVLGGSATGEEYVATQAQRVGAGATSSAANVVFTLALTVE